MTRKTLAKFIKQRLLGDTGNVDDIDAAIDLALRGIALAVTEGNSITLSNFGTFTLKYKGPNRGYNCKKHCFQDIPPRIVPHLKISRMWKAQAMDYYHQTMSQPTE